MSKNTSNTTAANAPAIVKMSSTEWEALMVAAEASTANQIILREFLKLEPMEGIVVDVKAGRDQETFVQDVSVFLKNKGHDKTKKKVRCHPTDRTKICVQRLA